MRRPTETMRAVRRHPTFEPCEPRLAMSGQPLSDFQLCVGNFGDQLESRRFAALPLASAGVAGSSAPNYVRNTYGLSGAGQTVAIIDSGIAYDHFALGRGFGGNHRVVGGWDFAENDADPYDDGPAGFHGTHVAGIVGSSDARYSGVAPGADLVALRVFDDQGKGQLEWVEQALRWVHEHRYSFAHSITTVNLSLGTDWNSSTIPNWASLEDELAQLRADGIFIAAAAGNSFQRNQTPGLSYPAASPHVVPVASVDADGQLSSFSQRAPRVLAAPGKSITSTVPDHIFGSDGWPNDFAAASGTSMAAPHVAGAAVLVRQAMELVEQRSVTQDQIDAHLRNTADRVFDPVTAASYLRINVAAAIDRLIPADDYGGTASTAYELGGLQTGLSFTGLIGRLDDRDCFQFTAQANGRVRLSATTQGDLALDLKLSDRQGTVDLEALEFSVVSGETYTLTLATDRGIGRYSVAADLEPRQVHWGTIDQRSFELNVGPTFQAAFQVVRDGRLTLQVAPGALDPSLRIEVYDATGTPLDSSSIPASGWRWDTETLAGSEYHLRFSGDSSGVALLITNLVSFTDAKIQIFGTAGDDELGFNFETGTARVNGVTYRHATQPSTSVRIDGNGGWDVVQVEGSSAAEDIVFRPDSLIVISPTCRLLAHRIASAQVDAGGGFDRAYYYDSAGNDLFSADPGYSRIRGAGFDHTGRGCEWVAAYATAGNDRAELFDSAGNDLFSGLPTYSCLRGEGFYHYVGGFDHVVALAGRGGYDRAYLYDSSGNDLFQGSPTYSHLRGDNFYNYAGGFDFVAAFATRGGYDQAFLYGSAGQDVFRSLGTTTVLAGLNFLNQAHGFEFVQAEGRGGQDVAEFLQLRARDHFFAARQLAGVRRAASYETVLAFAHVRAAAADGELPTAEVAAVDFVLERPERWRESTGAADPPGGLQ